MSIIPLFEEDPHDIKVHRYETTEDSRIQIRHVRGSHGKIVYLGDYVKRFSAGKGSRYLLYM
jgi:hypothetical protein